MKKLETAGVILLGTLFFVLPLPRTISLRDLLLVLVALCFGYLAWRRGRPRGELRGLYLPALLLAGLTAWMYFAAFFISPETDWAISELNSQWLRGLLACVIGASVAWSVSSRADLEQKALLAVCLALLAHVAYVDAMALYQWPQDWMQGRELNRISGLAGGPDKSNYVTNALFCFLFADFLGRRLRGKNLLPLSNAALWTALALTVFSMFAERMRNGVIVFVLLLAVTALLYLLGARDQIRKTTLMASVAALLVVVSGGLTLAVFIKPVQNPISLRNTLDTVVIAWDTERYKSWQDEKKYGLPTLPSGEIVDASLYMRVAWFKQGLLLIKEHPLGVGFGRNAFGHGLKAKYGEGRGHSHSGLLDFAIGNGVPGTLLWLGFFANLAATAYRRFRATHGAAAVLLLLLLLDFGLRMVVDSVIRDHMLQEFLFLVGLAAVLTMAEGPEKRKPPA